MSQHTRIRNKVELVAALYKELQPRFTKDDLLLVVDGVLAGITEAIGNGDSVVFRGFGTFRTRVRKGIKGRNPQKPEETIVIPEQTVVKFEAGTNLKEAVNR